MKPFTGAKIALICGANLIAYKRDLNPGIPFPGMWDLPGGGREGDETSAECALREVQEEFGIVVAPDRITWGRQYPGRTPEAPVSHFLVAHITQEDLDAVVFGDEGERREVALGGDVDRRLPGPSGGRQPPAPAPLRLPTSSWFRNLLTSLAVRESSRRACHESTLGPDPSRLNPPVRSRHSSAVGRPT